MRAIWVTEAGLLWQKQCPEFGGSEPHTSYPLEQKPLSAQPHLGVNSSMPASVHLKWLRPVFPVFVIPRVPSGLMSKYIQQGRGVNTSLGQPLTSGGWESVGHCSSFASVRPTVQKVLGGAEPHPTLAFLLRLLYISSSTFSLSLSQRLPPKYTIYAHVLISPFAFKGTQTKKPLQLPLPYS